MITGSTQRLVPASGTLSQSLEILQYDEQMAGNQVAFYSKLQGAAESDSVRSVRPDRHGTASSRNQVVKQVVECGRIERKNYEMNVSNL